MPSRWPRGLPPPFSDCNLRDTMPSITLQIADAVATMLSQANLSMPITAACSYTPDFDLTEMGTLHVTVVPMGRTARPADRTRQEYTHTLLIGIQKKIDPESETETTEQQTDALMDLVEEIETLLRRFTLEGAPAAQWASTEAQPIYDAKQLQTMGLFTAVLSVTYRTWS
jgi:hypothetical protein